MKLIMKTLCRLQILILASSNRMYLLFMTQWKSLKLHFFYELEIIKLYVKVVGQWITNINFTFQKLCVENYKTLSVQINSTFAAFQS